VWQDQKCREEEQVMASSSDGAPAVLQTTRQPAAGERRHADSRWPDKCGQCREVPAGRDCIFRTGDLLRTPSFYFIITVRGKGIEK
jgi:hypothetical protein